MNEKKVNPNRSRACSEKMIKMFSKMTKEERSEWAKSHMTDEWRNNIAKAKTGVPMNWNPEWKEKFREGASRSMKEWWAQWTPEERAEIMSKRRRSRT